MSETKVVLRDATRDISLISHGSDAHRVVAALSADPVTIEELGTALQRFMIVDPRRFIFGADDYLDDKPWDSGLVVIDLAARLVVVESTYFTTEHCGQVFYRNADERTDILVEYSLAAEWEISNDGNHWQELAARRRQERARFTTVDTRAVLYARPMLVFLATECWDAFHRDQLHQISAVNKPENTDPNSSLGQANPSADERSTSPVYDELKGIHARWLMSPCAELQGQTPRDVLLADRERLSEDMQQRCDQWARTQECPRGLGVTSYAFRFGGFGTHELVKYYEMVRELLWSCWNRLTELAPPNQAASLSIALSDFLATEVPRLERVRDEWLNTPDPDCHLRTPQSIIDRERARLPEALFGKDAIIDPDCPCCQMLAELPGPTFMHLDASGMDWEFPFDIYCRTREEWDVQQREYSEFNPVEGRDGSLFGMPATMFAWDGASSVWSRSFSMPESTDLPIGVRLLGIAWHVAELVMELNERVDSAALVDQLNRDFPNLREVFSGDDRSEMESLIDPVLERFDQTLGDIANEHPELEPRCLDLARKIKSLREPPAPVSS